MSHHREEIDVPTASIKLLDVDPTHLDADRPRSRPSENMIKNHHASSTPDTDTGPDTCLLDGASRSQVRFRFPRVDNLALEAVDLTDVPGESTAHACHLKTTSMVGCQIKLVVIFDRS